MKKQNFIALNVLSIGAFLAAASSAPAQQVEPSVNAPLSKVQRALPATSARPAPNVRIDSPQIERATGLGQTAVLRTLSPANQIIDKEVCIYRDRNFQGWKFCTMLTGPQALPGPYQGQATSMTIPEGFMLRLYERPDRTGRQCIFYGQVGAVSPECDNLAASIVFAPDPQWPRKQAEAQRRREEEEASEARRVQAAEREAEEEARRQEAAAPRLYAPQEVCLFEHPDFGGWRYCTNLRNFHTLPTQFQGQTSSLKIPEGYRVIIYEREDKSGQTCYYWGDISRTEGGCDDMVRAMKLEPDPDFPARQAAARQKADQDERDQAQAVQDEQRARVRRLHGSIGGICPGNAYESDGSYFSNLGGKSALCLLYGNAASLAFADYNDDIEKIVIFSGYAEFIFYEHANFQGRSIRLYCGIYNLEGEVEDKISSYRLNILDVPTSRDCNSSVVNEISRWDR
jgi:hypothetical protein